MNFVIKALIQPAVDYDSPALWPLILVTPRSRAETLRHLSSAPVNMRFAGGCSPATAADRRAAQSPPPAAASPPRPLPLCAPRCSSRWRAAPRLRRVRPRRHPRHPHRRCPRRYRRRLPSRPRSIAAATRALCCRTCKYAMRLIHCVWLCAQNFCLEDGDSRVRRAHELDGRCEQRTHTVQLDECTNAQHRDPHPCLRLQGSSIRPRLQRPSLSTK